MFHYIKGRLTMTFEGGIVIETGGIGYEIHVPDSCAAYSAGINEELLVYTKVIYKEDDASIYGFSDRETLEIFSRLMTVNGVGAKAALSILSALTLDELKRAIAFDDAVIFTRAQGIGKKIAQRIVLELKDKLPAGVSGPSRQVQDRAADEKDEAITGLMSLGYSRSEAAEAVNSVDPEARTTESYMKEALRSLMKR